ncbi:phospholipase D-like domain-containing protein [Flavobacterium sp.]|uniref:phospholipase D-like domain-containing protein n=1 Tax=Flavobacterium sp. TaxID=239 RepID=UPI002FDAA29A
MMRQRNILAVAFMAISFSLTYGQQTIKENDYTIVYNKSNIALQFNQQNAVIVSAIDVTKKTPVSLHKEGTGYILDNLTPAEIIKIDYQVTTQKSSTAKSAYLAVPSASSGTINVYFNHPVDTSYAQIQAATNLGNTVDDLLISYINACQSTLDIAIYNSSSPTATTGIAGAINAAYNRGVQVRVIYDGSTGGNMIGLLNVNIPKVASPVSSSYGIMHNKFVIFDANSSDPNKPYVWTGSTNWTVSQIDGPDRNSVIMIQDQALAQGYKIEFEEMWGSNTMTPDAVVSKFGPYKTDNTPHTYIIGGKTINSYFSPSDNTNTKIIATINTANTDIDVATMLITRSDISNALIMKYNSGLTNVNVVVDSQNPSGNQITTLQSSLLANHAVVYTNSGILHHKFMVVDNFNSASDPLVLLGSHNWSSSAENKNDENTLIVHDLNIANQYYQAFAYLYQDAGGVIMLANPEFTTTEFALYPNPTTGIVTLEANATALNDVSVTVYDALGKSVFTNQYTTLLHEDISISNQAAGLYFVNIRSNGKSWSYKVVKN